MSGVAARCPVQTLIEESRPISKRKSWVVLGEATGGAPGLARRRSRAAAVEAEPEVTIEAGGAA